MSRTYLFLGITSLGIILVGVAVIPAIYGQPVPQPLLPAQQLQVPTSQVQTLSQTNEPTPQAGTWTDYTNAQYHYTLSYTGTLGFDYSTPAVELLYITIDPNAEPIHVCAAGNSAAWTAIQLFEHWKQEPPSTGSEFPCADYPSYARVSGSAIKIDNRSAYQVTSFRGPFETVCTYFASVNTLLAICLPPENSSEAPAWQDHFKVYNQIVASVKIPE